MADVQYLFHDQIDCVGYPHFDWICRWWKFTVHD